MEPTTSRRLFLKKAGLSGIALTLGAYLPAFAKAETIINAANSEGQATELMTWISIDKPAKVTLLNHRSEMGQCPYQAAPQMSAEKLKATLTQTKTIFAPGNPQN